MTPFTIGIDGRSRLLARGCAAGVPGFSGGQGSKRRPVLVVHDFGDADLLVVPITSHPARVATDVPLPDWRSAGLKLPSTVRVEKLATIDKTCVARNAGALLPGDRAKVKETLASVFRQILP